MPRPMNPDIASDVPNGRVRCRVEVVNLQNGNVLLTSDPTSSAPRFNVVDGNISIDETRNIQGSGTLTVLLDETSLPTVLPVSGNHALSPIAGNAVQISFFPSSDPTTVSYYGRYEIGDVNITEGPGGPMADVSIFDYSRKVSFARFFRPLTLGPDVYANYIWHLLTAVIPGSQIYADAYPYQLGVYTYDVEDDRLSAVNELTTSVGFRADWNFDGKGGAGFFFEYPENTSPMFSFVEDSDARIISVTRGLSDEKSYNGVIARGESTGSGAPPVSAEWWDQNPNSLMYFDPNNPGASSYGPKPFFYVSQFITTYEQALGAAQARLPKVSGMVEMVSLETQRNPAIIPGDIIRVERPEVGVESNYVVSSVDLPLGPGWMKITCRERRIFT